MEIKGQMNVVLEKIVEIWQPKKCVFVLVYTDEDVDSNSPCETVIIISIIIIIEA